jgi:two-component system sensor histidine kinase DesK
MTAFVALAAIAVAGIIRADHHPVVLAIALAAAAGYTTLFVWYTTGVGDVGDPPRRRRWLAVLGALAALLALFAPGEVLFVTAVGAVAALHAPPRQATVAVAVVGLAALAIVWFDSTLPRAFGSAAQVTAICCFCYGWARLVEANRALEAARGEVARLAVADERTRFARDLHDLLGHTLSVVRIKSELAARIADSRPDVAKHEMIEIEQISRAALAEVRQAVAGYRRPELAGELVRAATTLDGLGIEATVHADDVRVAPDIDEALAWVVREATTNVVRHSNADRCTIRLAREDRQVVLEVTDNGIGRTEGDHDGNGLQGMRERVAALGGDVLLDGAPGSGCRVRVTVPATPTVPTVPTAAR